MNKLFKAKRAEIEWWDRDVLTSDDLIGTAELNQEDIYYLKTQIINNIASRDEKRV